METFHNVFQCGAREVVSDSVVTEMAGHWRDKYFHNDHPIVLELGCGRGEYTVGLAQRDPNKNYIGIDIKGARMWAGAKQAEQAGMKNVAFLRTNIEMLCHFCNDAITHHFTRSALEHIVESLHFCKFFQFILAHLILNDFYTNICNTG